MRMDCSPEPCSIKKKDEDEESSCINTSQSPQLQESPFLKFISNLSPIQPVKSCHMTQGFVGLSSPPIVFMSPRISCHSETKFLERTQSLSADISESDNGGKSLVNELPGDSINLRSQLSLPGSFTTDTTQTDVVIKNDANTQNCSPSASVDEYLADPVDIDRIYSANPDVKLSDDAIETLKHGSEDGPGDRAEQTLLLSQESNKFHQEKPACVEEPGKVEEQKLSADVLETQYRHDSHAQCAGSELQEYSDQTPEPMPEPVKDAKECEDCDEMVSTSHVSTENISQCGSEATLKHHGIRRRCLQFGEVALGSNNSHANLNATSSKMKMVKLSEPVTSLFPQRCSGIAKPSGIGLHLNSIINAIPPGCAATTGIKSTLLISLHRMDNMKRCLISSNMDGQASIDTGNESHEIDASTAADSLNSESPSLAEPIPVNPASVHGKRKLSPTDAGNSEEFNRSSPIKKKKKISITNDENSCKRCNCKKSKCLKLYCDCFAAGIYCSDPCSCQGCLNRQEYQETVLETRRQIESRNPLAFLPKVVQHTTDIPSTNMEDANLTTPSSARHKRGCNCKRSMCLKKYCECYQANVGCSSGCRCEGCKNAYGRKEDYVPIEHALSKERVVEQGSDKTFYDKLDMVVSKPELYDLHRLSPITPSLQCSDQGKEAAKSRLLSGKYLPSPESADVNMIPSHKKYTKPVPDSHPEIDSYEWQMDQLSPTCNSAADVLTPVSSYPPEPISFSAITKESADIPQSRLSHAPIRHLSGGSLRWRSSPNTPRTRISETKYVDQSLESDSRRLFDILEDETPDILKEVSTPTNPVKANSPNQKRVSPPHGHSHLRGLGLSSSGGGLKSGRKFILKAVPSFPPLTPCADSKGNDDDHENLGNCSSK
ncbi:hypothetical protein TanjilG_01246 [Lupinus angustifolius]|uniref:CRC domain-containing protein n=1 Tax=Lupinus angustifolius TaxID=3871 RepID=A0A4P1RER4_LUPAN|nr:PREDICTED: protein tesmin/TSO1-like CXC 2 isoform X1 [Lupinus angustifolius]OIW09275.1 hypothetical protein TanjilG_01246 [Lupinus angustifolius]